MVDELSPVSRVLLALEAIQSTPGITATRLSQRLGVTDRAARRYVAMLREAGIPIESRSGRYGGYRLGRGARVPPLMFSSNEAVALVMALLQGWHGSIDEDRPAANALAKILRVLPAPTAAALEGLRRVQAQNPGEASAAPAPDTVALIARAGVETQTVWIRYSSGRSEWSAKIDPWAVIVRHGRWYALCWSHAASAQRVLRIDRITELKTTADSFTTRPDDLDAVTEVERHLTSGWALPARVRIAAPMTSVAPFLPRALGLLRPDGDDACVLEGSTDDPAWYATQLAAIPAPFDIEHCDEIRAETLTLSARLATAAGPRRPN